MRRVIRARVLAVAAIIVVVVVIAILWLTPGAQRPVRVEVDALGRAKLVLEPVPRGADPEWAGGSVPVFFRDAEGELRQGWNGRHSKRKRSSCLRSRGMSASRGRGAGT